MERRNISLGSKDLSNYRKECNYIIKKLLKHDIVVQVVESVTTNTIYLKLDCGQLGTIRISDHDSSDNKKSISKYNINMSRSWGGISTKEVQGQFDSVRTVYDAPNYLIDTVIQLILESRTIRINKYGSRKYRFMMEKTYYDNAHDKDNRFWRSCKWYSSKLVREGRVTV